MLTRDQKLAIETLYTVYNMTIPQIAGQLVIPHAYVKKHLEKFTEKTYPQPTETKEPTYETKLRALDKRYKVY